MAERYGSWTRRPDESGGYFHPDVGLRVFTVSSDSRVWDTAESDYPHAKALTSKLYLVSIIPVPWHYTQPFQAWLMDYRFSGYAYAADLMPEPFPSDAYYEAIRAMARESRITGEITLRDGTALTITDESIKSESLTIATNCMLSDYFLPGCAACAELHATVNYPEISPLRFAGAEISPIYEITLTGGEVYRVPLGVYTVTLPELSEDEGISLTARDDMHKLELIDIAELRLRENTVYSPQELVDVCAHAAGLACPDDLSTYPNGNCRIAAANADTRIETARDLLMFTAQIVGSIAYVDRFRQLRIRQTARSEPLYTVTAHMRTSLSKALAEYRLHRLYNVQTVHNRAGAVGMKRIKYITLSTEGVDAELPENPLLAVASDAAIKPVLDALDMTVYTPFTAETYGDPALDPLDFLDVEKGAETTSAPVTSYEWRYRAGMTVTACGTDAVSGNLRTLAEKQVLAGLADVADATGEISRDIIKQYFLGGHKGLAMLTHAELSHFTHAELATKEVEV